MAGQVRHPIPLPSLETYIRTHVPQILTPLTLKQFGFGQSNPTYLLTSPNGSRYVLRKKPPGKLVSKTAHKVEREHRVLSALGPTPVPVPKTYALCEDASVIGTPFYIMEFLDGRIIEDPLMPGVSERERREMWSDAVRTLAKLHRVDVKDVGLEGFGKPSGFYDRQIQTWKTICTAQGAVKDVETGKEVGQLGHFDEMMRFFGDRGSQPRERSGLVHGDYKIDNLVFHKSESRVIGILDWEMSTTGHPLSDLANFLTPFYTSTSANPDSHAAFQPGATPGLPTAQEITALYCRAAGWGTSANPEAWPDMQRELQWTQAFNIFRQAAICQGIAARVATRQASSAVAIQYVERVQPLADLAWELVQETDKGGGNRGKL